MQSLITDFHRSCRDIQVCRHTPALNYAVGYAEAGLSMTDPKEIQVQCLYILNNITGWRGPIASQARLTFKRLSKPATWKESV